MSASRKRSRLSKKSKSRMDNEEELTSFVPVRVSLQLDQTPDPCSSDYSSIPNSPERSEAINNNNSASDMESDDDASQATLPTAADEESTENQEMVYYTEILIEKLMDSDASSANFDDTDKDSAIVDEIDAVLSSNKDEELEKMWHEAHEQLINENENLAQRESEESEAATIDEGWFEADEILQLCTSTLIADREENDNDDSQTAEHGENKKSDPDQEPLYDGSTVTIGSVMVLLALFVIKHNLSGEAIEHLLSIIAAVLPSSNILPRTINRFRKYFCRLKNPFVIHNYCSFCLAYLGKRKSGNCPNSHCLKDLTVKGGVAFFIEIPLIHQLQTMFSRSGFHDDLQHRFRRKKKKINNIEDVYDGKVYQTLVKQGILQSPNNFSFIFNTDGVPVFKSSKISIWPVLLVINELPYRKRMATENMLFAGLWFGEKKPAMWTFLKPFFKSLVELEQGVPFQIKDKGLVTCRAVLLGGTCDLPARCLICNAMQYNGASSCWKCIQEGKTAKVGLGHTTVFPYQEKNPKGPQRTHSNTLRHAKEALKNLMSGTKKYLVHGIKGPSWLALIPRFDYVTGIGIDYMHGVLLGVQKTLLRLWFSSSFKGEKFNFYNLLSRVDNRLSEIAPTLEIKRMPRSISEHLRYWKANELRSFLLYFGIPVLYGILPDAYFQHYALLVQAVYILLKDSISCEDLQQAEKLLFLFTKCFSQLYNERFMTLNFHQLVHLADDVRDLGPLYTHSCFSFEDKNGFLLRLIHGTQFIDTQIMTAVSFVQKIPELRETCISPNTDAEDIYLSLTHPRRPTSSHLISQSQNAFRLGASYVKSLTNMEFAALQKYLGYTPVTVMVTAFNRITIFKDNRLIYGTNYKRMYKRNCSVVKYVEQGTFHFAEIQFFFKFQINGDSRNLVMAKPLQLRNPYSVNNHISVVAPADDCLIAFDLENISCNVIFLTFSDEPHRAYVCEFPNCLEVD